jgi:hypothetical protein
MRLGNGIAVNWKIKSLALAFAPHEEFAPETSDFLP